MALTLRLPYIRVIAKVREKSSRQPNKAAFYDIREDNVFSPEAPRLLPPGPELYTHW